MPVRTENQLVTRLDIPIASYAQPLPTPTLTKRPDVTVGTCKTVGLPTVYAPWIVRASDAAVKAYPQYGRWRIYTSTDHDSGAGGIAIGVNPSDDTVFDPAQWTWLRRGTSGKMFTEDSSAQVETPSVVENPATGLFHMYYQYQRGSGSSLVQETRLVTSADGVTNWSAPVTVIPTLDASIAGWGHTGYAKVFIVDGLWCAWHLQGAGGRKSGYGWSFSNDGVDFVTDRRRVNTAVHMTDGVLRFGVSCLLHYRGSLWALGTGADVAASGKTSSSQVKVWVAPINQSDDLRSLRGRPQFLPWTVIAPETTLGGPPPVFAAHPDGSLIGAYRVNGATGSIALAVLT
jgi:hypothetical protein